MKTLPALLLACITMAAAAETPRQPNVIFILADDLGWADTSLYGKSRFHQTPHLDRLAARGMTFDRAYSASPLCSPTRSAILTGLSPARTGITSPVCHEPTVREQATLPEKAGPGVKVIQPQSASRLRREYTTLAETLKREGYATAHFGKWHLGAEPYSPLQQGFDTDIPHYPGPGPARAFVAPWSYLALKPETPEEHIEDRMAREAVKWMEQHKDQPFFLNYWMFSVHAPFDAKKNLIEKHARRVDPADEQRCPTYAAMIESMDDAVGTLLDAIDRLGLAQNTIIIFTSDNGGNMYDRVQGIPPTSNRPLRGGKATLFEGGIRVPCVISWPGVTRPGSRSETLLQSEDFHPTLLAGLGIAPASSFDGTDLFKSLSGTPADRGPLFHYFPHSPQKVPDHLPPAIAVRSGDWKLIRIFHDQADGAHRHLLFNIREDESESKNLADAQPGRVKELGTFLDSFLADTRALLPKRNPSFDPNHVPPKRPAPKRKPAPR